MSIELKIPEVGESITEVQIGDWLKAEGDAVNADEAVAVIDSEKTTFELSAPKGGRLAKILHKAGETVKVGEVIAQIEPGEDAETKKPEKPQEPKATARPESPAPKSEKKTSAGVEPREGKTTQPESDPKQRQEKESEKRKQPDSPSKEQLPAPEPKTESAPSKFTSNGEEEVVPMTMLRRTVARRLVEAQQNMAMLTTINEADLSAVQSLRKQHGEAFEKRYGVKLGLMSFFVKAAIDALKQFPELNAEIRDTNIVYRNYFDIGVAIATDRGLVVPVLRRAERTSFAELEQAIGEFAKRGREGKLKPEELAGGTFTITNGGVFGSLLSTPIINPPQTGILGLHTIQDRPVAVGGQVVIRPLMYLALTYDHRLVDGREAVLFVRRIKEAIENPARMLVEI